MFLGLIWRNQQPPLPEQINVSKIPSQHYKLTRNIHPSTLCVFINFLPERWNPLQTQNSVQLHLVTKTTNSSSYFSVCDIAVGGLGQLGHKDTTNKQIVGCREMIMVRSLIKCLNLTSALFCIFTPPHYPSTFFVYINLNSHVCFFFPSNPYENLETYTQVHSYLFIPFTLLLQYVN